MLKPQRKIKPSLKRLLVEKSGGKCGNPGCTNWRIHIHHIKHWSVYKAHDPEHMIAICPSCHDEIHHGKLEITDDILCFWKGIKRPPKPTSAQIYIEPSRDLRILTGSIAFATRCSEAIVFDFSNTNRLSFRVVDQDILQLNLQVATVSGRQILRVVDNHVRVVDDAVDFQFRAGRAQVVVPISQDYVPSWLVEQMGQINTRFACQGRLVALDLEVLRPGLVRVQGCWPNENHAIVIDELQLVFCRRNHLPVPIVGDGEKSLLIWTGPLNAAMFGFAPNQAAAVRIGK
jgi:hypothetical protein